MTNWINYCLFDNPISRTSISIVKAVPNIIGLKEKNVKVTEVAVPKVTEIMSLRKLLGCSNRNIIRLAGICGAAAVALGAYGAHHAFVQPNMESEKNPKDIFEMTNRYHYLHTLALLAAPMARKPILTTILFSSGMILFCGTCYYISFTGDRKYAKITPIGGLLLICGWLSFVL